MQLAPAEADLWQRSHGQSERVGSWCARATFANSHLIFFLSPSGCLMPCLPVSAPLVMIYFLNTHLLPLCSTERPEYEPHYKYGRISALRYPI